LSDLRSRLGGLRELRTARELLLFAYLTSFAATVPLLMRLPLPRLAALLTRDPRRPPPSTAEVERIERMIALAPRVARPLVHTGCLTRGVTLFWFLRRAGLDVELRFGVDVEDHDATDGHCWLSLADEPFLEQVDPRPRFAELYRFPLQAR
jgi:hypothetical protein